MTVLEMVRKQLLANGWDGLCNGDGFCGCNLQDLAPCGDVQAECQAAMEVIIPANGVLQSSMGDIIDYDRTMCGPGDSWFIPVGAFTDEEEPE